MAAPVYRPSGVLAGTFGVGILTFLLLPSEVGYQDLAALISRDAATVERSQKHSRVSALGTLHASNLNMPQPVGAGILQPSLGYTLAGLDPNNAEITGSIRDLISGRAACCWRLLAQTLGVDRTHKGDQLTTAARRNENVAQKGDRLDAGSVRQAEVQRNEAAPVPQVPALQVPAPQVAEAPATPSGEPPQVVVQAEPLPEAERQNELQLTQPQLGEQAEGAPQAKPQPVELTEHSPPVEQAEGTQPPQAANSPAQIAEAELNPPPAAETSEQAEPTRQAKVELKSAERDADVRPSKVAPRRKAFAVAACTVAAGRTAGPRAAATAAAEAAARREGRPYPGSAAEGG